MTRKRRNPVNWERPAWWHEAAGSKPTPPKIGKPLIPLTTVSQHVMRREIVDVLCDELADAGFRVDKRIERDKTIRCHLTRVEEKRCFVERTRPHYLSKRTRKWAQDYLREIKRREKRRARPRIPFRCPT